MWFNLFFDKFSGDANGVGSHHYSDSVTKNISNPDDLNDGTYQTLFNSEAITKFNNLFLSKQILPIPVVLPHNIIKVILYTKKQNGLTIIITVISVNVAILEHIIKKKEKFPEIDFIRTSVKFHILYSGLNKNSDEASLNDSIKFVINNAMIPTDYTNDNYIPDPVEINMQLYHYQKCSIKWMMDMENTPTVLTYTTNPEINMGNIYYDTRKQIFDHIENKKKITFSGGALIDEVGLGKTIQMISLMINNISRPQQPVINNRIYTKATLVMCPNQLCGQWIREINEKLTPNALNKLSIIKILTKKDFDKISYKDIVNADIVILSFTFLDNKSFNNVWMTDLGNASFHKKKWDMTNNIDVAKKFDTIFNDIKDKYNDMTNPIFTLFHWHRIIVDEFHEIYKDFGYVYVHNILQHIRSNNKWCVTATPFGSAKYLDHIVDFVTNYNNSEDTSMHIYKNDNIIDYLSNKCFRRNTKLSVEAEYKLPAPVENVIMLKFSATERLMYNAYLANQDNDRFSVYLRQLCCHPQLAEETKEMLSNCKTLQDIEKMMLTHYQNDVNHYKNKRNKIMDRINKLNAKIKAIEEKKIKPNEINLNDLDDLNDFTDDVDDFDELLDNNLNARGNITLNYLKEDVLNTQQKLNAMNKILDGKESTLNFYKTVIERLQKTATQTVDKNKKITEIAEAEISMDSIEKMLEDEDPNEMADSEMCGICMDKISQTDIGVTKCGHIYCYGCIKTSVSKFHNCPMCKKQLGDKDIFIVYQKIAPSESSSKDKDLVQLINEYGTKLAHVITFLKTTPKHTIIFSQWDDLLRRVGAVLDKNNIKNVFCRGNCYQRDKAIREFNSDDKIKVIMLSSDSSAAGTNLTKASQIIFLDPIYGTLEFRKNQERQAIGRAHRLGQKSIITIMRYIIEDSVESEIHRLNQQQEAKK